MRTNLKTLLGTAAIFAAMAGSSAVHAQAETKDQKGSGGMMQGGPGGMMQGGPGGMMGQGGGMMGMMNMMQQMSQMMETCNNMMQGMTQPETPKEGTTPEKKG